MRTWNKRAVQGALIRLDQSGMIKRFRVRKREAVDFWVICIEIQREPRPEDVENLGFKRQAPLLETVDELLQDDGDGDTLMRDLEVDMLDDENEDETKNDLEEDIRIPPQWTPDRLLANIVFDVTALGGEAGWDAIAMRNRIAGPFWRRPMDSHLTRLTDDWKRMQPAYLRHLAIIRDARTSEEKKFIHYIYRTYKNFEQAVATGEAAWEGVSKAISKTVQATHGSTIDQWGFHNLDQKEFVRFNGTATLLEVRNAIPSRKYGPRWDNALAQEIGYHKAVGTPSPKTKVKSGRKKSFSSKTSHKRPTQLDDDQSVHIPEANGETDDMQPQSPPTPSILKIKRASKTQAKTKTSKTKSSLTLTPEQRIALGLKPTGRLTKSAARQILAHRRETGDPTSLPSEIVDEEPVQRGRAPLLTAEERLARNLPVKGRLGTKMENQLREERGLPVLDKKHKRKPEEKESTILSKQQRIALGFKGHGRLHQHFIDALRKERDDEIPLEDSPAVKAYREFLAAGAPKTATKRTDAIEAESSPARELASRAAAEEERTTRLEDDVANIQPPTPQSTDGNAKRRADHDDDDEDDAGPVIPKRQRTLVNALQEGDVSMTLQSAAVLSETTSTSTPHAKTTNGTSKNTEIHVEDTHDLYGDTPPHASSVPGTETAFHTPGTLVNAEPPGASNEITTRSSPGIYIYPSAKSRATRGRPRKAFVLVVRLASLNKLQWFKPDSGTYDVSQTVTLGPFKLPRKELMLEIESADAPTPPATADTTLPLPDSFCPMLETSRDIQPRPDSAESSNPVAQVEEKDHEQYRSHGPEETSQIEISVLQNELSEEAQPAAAFPSPQQSTLISEPSYDIQERQSSQAMQSMPRMAAGWNAVNTYTHGSPSSYQSPYAPSPRSNSVPVTEQASTATTTDTVVLATNTNAPETTKETSLLDGVVSTIADVELPGDSGQHGFKATGPGSAGSAAKFRTEIIQEIIDRCGGVYPFHGEIYRPFSALWDERHGHTTIRKPGTSTVTNSLKYMISQPNYGLKRMVFSVRARNASGVKQKVIVARSDKTATDPAVVRLVNNMVTEPRDKSGQYFPEEIRDLFEYTKLYDPTPIAPIDDTIILDKLYPHGLDEQIRLDKKRRRQEKAVQKKRDKVAAALQNQLVEEVLPKRRARAQRQIQTPAGDAPRAKRTRLASLNDKNKTYRRAPLKLPVLDDVDEELGSNVLREPSPAPTDSSEDLPLMTLRPWISEVVEQAEDEDSSPSDADEKNDEALEIVEAELQPQRAVDLEVNHVTRLDDTPSHAAITTEEEPTTAVKERKRVRIAESVEERPSKRARIDGTTMQTLDAEFVYSEIEDSDETSSEDDEEEAPTKPKRKRRKAFGKRQVGKKDLPLPTLLERLTGLTGDPNDPVYKDPKQRQRPGYGAPWSEKKKKKRLKQQKEREYSETLDTIDKFKKFCCTLIIASSMSGEGDVVEWSIVEKVYSRDKFFDLTRVKKLWAWVRAHMTAQLGEITTTVQSTFLDAYEQGRIPAIEYPATYDWAGLLRWVVKKCQYPEVPLPVYHEALQHFTVDESSYLVLDRSAWYTKKLADSKRTQLQLHYSYTAPLHLSCSAKWSPEDKALKARSWIRANTATPQSRYNANNAHDKLKLVGEDILVKVVGDFVQEEHLKMRKIKRQLPGRNYTFTKKFAKDYKRPFELGDFMIAVNTKKDLDVAFANEDPTKRFYSVSSCEEDGSIMAITSLVNDGRVKIVPQLPHINNVFGAPLPRLSKWGFCEGDYIHRAIDRNRMFWDIHVVPTSSYQFGNPLQPLADPALMSDGLPEAWEPLPDPPLPGKHDPNVLLPIWSSIDGIFITWPWWYRILNLVLQPLFLQPGATAKDVFSHCAEHTTELFEVELVLGWLVDVGAVIQIIGGGYQATPNFWAVFGDRLFDTEDDWFGEHVKRKSKLTEKQQWREKYNLRYSTIQIRGAQSSAVDVEQVRFQDGNAMSRQIVEDPKAQYRIVQEALPEPGEQDEGRVTEAEMQQQAPAATDAAHTIVPPPSLPQTLIAATWSEVVEMQDAGNDADAEGEDVDAEGEIDEAMF
jgi:hypothetical protein